MELKEIILVAIIKNDENTDKTRFFTKAEDAEKYVRDIFPSEFSAESDGYVSEVIEDGYYYDAHIDKALQITHIKNGI